MDVRIWIMASVVLATGCEAGSSERRADITPPPAVYDVTIPTPRVLEGLPIGPPDASGQPTVAPCSTCHLPADTAALPRDAGGLGGPHVGLQLRHGELPCASCHAERDRGALHLADGTDIPLTDALRLCAQCHGPQFRDYSHGAHGGMRGHWDLSRGPRERNHCVACHDPHAPAFGHFRPLPGPRDRFTGESTPTETPHE